MEGRLRAEARERRAMRGLYHATRFPALCRNSRLTTRAAAACGLRSPQHHQSIERICSAAASAHHERIDVDGLDDITQIACKVAEIDECVDEHLDVARLAAAKSIEQASRPRCLDHGESPIPIECGGRKAHVLEQFDPDAAEAEHHDRP